MNSFDNLYVNRSIEKCIHASVIIEKWNRFFLFDSTNYSLPHRKYWTRVPIHGPPLKTKNITFRLRLISKLNKTYGSGGREGREYRGRLEPPPTEGVLPPVVTLANSGVRVRNEKRQ